MALSVDYPIVSFVLKDNYYLSDVRIVVTKVRMVVVIANGKEMLLSNRDDETVSKAVRLDSHDYS